MCFECQCSYLDFDYQNLNFIYKNQSFQEDKRQVLARVWRKVNSPTLLVGR